MNLSAPCPRFRRAWSAGCAVLTLSVTGRAAAQGGDGAQGGDVTERERVALVSAQATADRGAVVRSLSALAPAPGLAFDWLPPQALSDPAVLERHRLLVSDAEAVSAAGFSALEAYVAQGGVLVALGSFGRWLDADGNGRFDRGTDPPAQQESERLTGCAVLAGDLAATKVRVFGDLGVLRGFHAGRWVEPPQTAPGATSLRIAGDAVPLAEACFRPRGHAAAAFRPAALAPRTAARYDSYATARPLGNGMVVRVAAPLLDASSDAWARLWWRNLLDRANVPVLRSGHPVLVDPEIVYEHGSLIPNPDFEESIRVTRTGAPGESVLAGETYLAPAHWQFNSWKGRYEGRLLPHTNAFGGLVLALSSDDPESRGGGANWRAICSQTRLHPGRRYRLSLLARADGIVRGQATLRVVNASGTPTEVHLPLPSGSFAWQPFVRDLTLPATDPATRNLLRGFSAGVSFTGPGALLVDHVVLQTLTIPGEP